MRLIIVHNCRVIHFIKNPLFNFFPNRYTSILQDIFSIIAVTAVFQNIDSNFINAIVYKILRYSDFRNFRTQSLRFRDCDKPNRCFKLAKCHHNLMHLLDFRFLSFVFIEGFLPFFQFYPTKSEWLRN